MILLGSSRRNGNTVLGSRLLAKKTGAELIELTNYFIGFYDYENRNSGDDFIVLAEKIAEADRLIFATPVYWYAMSAQMKVFLDRFTDLITIRKALGRKLAGKRAFLLATGTDAELPEGFEIPFRLTSRYFDMTFVDSCYLRFEKDFLPAPDYLKKIERFGALIV